MALYLGNKKIADNGGSGSDIPVTKAEQWTFVLESGETVVKTVALSEPGAVYWTVRFVDYNGYVLKTQQVQDGHDATPPSDPVRQGFIFTGWEGDYTAVHSDKTITAQYQIRQYTMTVEQRPNGTIVSNPLSGIYNYGQVFNLTATPSAGYEISAWSTGEISSAISVALNTNLTVYCDFKVLEPRTIISSDLSGLAWSISDNWGLTTATSGTYEIVKAGQVSPPSEISVTFQNGQRKVFSQDGNGYYSTTSPHGQLYLKSLSATDGRPCRICPVSPSIYAELSGIDTIEHLLSGYTDWTQAVTTHYIDLADAVPVTVIFMNEGIEHNKQIIPSGNKVVTPSTPSKGVQYNFTGWYTASIGGELVDLSTKMFSADTVLYARYAVKPEYKATVTFMTDDVVYSQKEGVIGETLGEIPTATKSGYAFVGWYQKESGAYTTEFTGSTVLTGNLTVYAKFSDVSDWANILDSIQDLTVGNDLVAPPAYGFDSIVFEVVDKDHVPVSGYTKTVTLQTKYVISKTDGDRYTLKFSTDPSIGLWKDAFIRTWLNDETTPTNMYDSFLGSFKLDATGAAKTGTDLAVANAFINALKSPSIETYVTEGTKETTSDKVWIPSIYEVGGGIPEYSYGQEGFVLDKYSAAPGTGDWDVRMKFSTIPKTGAIGHWYLRSVGLKSSVYYWGCGVLCTYPASSEQPTSGYFGSIAGNITQSSEMGHVAAPLITLAYNTCTVTYKYNDGSTPDTVQTRAVGAHAVKINPVRSGYYFDAWYTDEALTKKFDFTNTVLTSTGVTLYAKWRDVDWTNLSAKMATMNVGDLVEAPSAYGFDKIVLEMVDRDHVDVTGVDHTTTHTVTLQTKCLLTNTDGSAYTKRWDNDSNDWEASDIRTWLNGDFLNAFLKNADGTAKTGDDLVQSQAFIDAIQSAIIKTKPYSGSESDYRTTNDKVWLPSVYQVNGASTYSNEGPVLDKYNTFDMTTSSRTERVKTTTGTDGKGTGGSANWWWLRSAHSNYSAYVWRVSGSGYVSYDIVGAAALGVSPLMTFKY